MTDHDRAALRRLAEAATPGPWTPSLHFIIGSEEAVAQVVSNNGGDARYIAAMSPDVALRLLDDLAALDRALHAAQAEASAAKERAAQALEERDGAWAAWQSAAERMEDAETRAEQAEQRERALRHDATEAMQNLRAAQGFMNALDDYRAMDFLGYAKGNLEAALAANATPAPEVKRE